MPRAPTYVSPHGSAAPASKLDDKTRTLLTEIDVDNREGKFLPGSFAKVALHLKMPSAVQVPCEALVAREGKSFVGLLTDDHKVAYTEIGVAESDGKLLTVTSGLLEGVKVVLNPGMSLAEGTHVQPFDLGGQK